MNKTININLAGIIFYVDEDAYNHFSTYLQRVKAQFVNTEERAEIIADIEARIAELLQQKLGDNKQVVNMADVEEIISIMGSPEDYAIEDDEGPEERSKKDSSHTGQSNFNYTGPKRLYRNPDDKILSGLSSGIALYFGIDPIWVRLIWIALFFGWGTGFFIYIILWIVMPEAKTTAQKLQMRGERINIDNIEKSVKEEMNNIKDKFESYRKKNVPETTGGKIRQTIEEIVAAVLSIFKYIIMFVFKFMGGILMVVGILLLISLIATFLGSDININGNSIDITNIAGYLSALFNSSAHSWLFVTGIVMLALAPVIGIILLSMRILFNYRNNNKFVGVALGVISIIGFVILFATGIIMVRSFASTATYTETIELGGTHKNYALQVTDFLDNERPYDLDWTLTDKYQLLANVEMDVKPTSKPEPFIEKTSESRGRNKAEARKRAKNYEFYAEKNDSIISFADYFLVPADEKYRGQDVHVRLYLPVGYSIYLDESLISLIYDIDNVTNMHDDRMLNHWWVMTQNGLACMDCNEGNTQWKDKEDWDNYEDQFEAEAQETEIQRELREAERNLEKARREMEQKIKDAQRELDKIKKK